MTSIVIKSSDPAAPVLSGTVGALITVLDTCLIVNHVFGTSDDLAFTDQRVEARSEAGTPFTLLLTNVTAARLYIGMPTPFPRARFDLAVLGVGGTYVWEYWNGTTWVTLTVTDGTSGFTADGTVTWTIPGTWATTAVNAVTQYWVRVRASVIPSTNPTINFLTVGGWTQPFALVANQMAYRQGPGSNGFFVRITDDGTTSPAYGRITGFETMSSLTVGTGQFPTTAQHTVAPTGNMFLHKSSTADATARPWVIAVSEKLFHILVDIDSTGANGLVNSFGDIRKFKSNDAYHTLIMANASATNTTLTLTGGALIGNVSATPANTNGGHYTPRSFTQSGTSTAVNKSSDAFKNANALTIGAAGLTFPNLVDNSLYIAPIWLNEMSVIRGDLPGLWCPLHARPITHMDTFSGTGTLSGKIFLGVFIVGVGQVFLETSDTWNV